MGLKTLEVTVISARDLKNVNLIGKMDVYVVVHLSDEPKNKQKTPVHQDGGTSPAWNYTMRFTVDEAAAAKAGKYLVFTLKHEQTFGSDKELGEVLVPLRELFDSVKAKDAGPQFATYQVRRSSGKAKGELKFSFKVIDMGQSVYSTSSSRCAASAPHAGVSRPYPPSTGYPAPYQSAAAPYPPPQKAHAAYPPYQQAPPAVYPPQQAHVGYPPHSQPPIGVPYAAPQGYPPYGGYPPQPAGYGYSPTGGYPPQPAGYGYPPTGGYPAYPAAQGYGKPQKPKKNSNFGMGLGAGLLGGAIGGLVLGEVMDDTFDDGGFDGGFDF